MYNCIIKQELDIKRLLCLTNHSQRNAANLQRPEKDKDFSLQCFISLFSCESVYLLIGFNRWGGAVL